MYGVVRDHLETFLSRAGETGGDGYPRFVEHEFRRYLDCGLLCHGFARLRCAECGYERLVAFSCKGKLRPRIACKAELPAVPPDRHCQGFPTGWLGRGLP